MPRTDSYEVLSIFLSLLKKSIHKPKIQYNHLHIDIHNRSYFWSMYKLFSISFKTILKTRSCYVTSQVELVIVVSSTFNGIQ